MPTPQNIQLFDQVVIHVLVKLYNSFPDPLDLSCTDIGAEVAEALEGDADAENNAARLILSTASSTLGFLVREGFIHYEPEMRWMNGPEFPGAVLTLKGITLLGLTPSSVDERADRRPFIDQLHDAAERGAEGARGCSRDRRSRAWR